LNPSIIVDEINKNPKTTGSIIILVILFISRNEKDKDVIPKQKKLVNVKIKKYFIISNEIFCLTILTEKIIPRIPIEE